MSKRFFKDYFKFMQEGITSVNYNNLRTATKKIRIVSNNDNKLIIAGNGGSAAMASHVSVDFTKAAGVKAINFNEADLLTCFANDYGYERVFEKAVDFYGNEGDMLILISSSGNSANVINAAKHARNMNIEVITFSGFDSDNEVDPKSRTVFLMS